MVVIGVVADGVDNVAVEAPAGLLYMNRSAIDRRGTGCGEGASVLLLLLFEWIMCADDCLLRS